MKLQDVAFIQLESNISDRLIKVKKNAVLLKTVLICRLDLPIQKWMLQNAKGYSFAEEVGVSLD